MAFGSFFVTDGSFPKREKKERPAKAPKAPKEPKPVEEKPAVPAPKWNPATGGMTVSVVLVGRTREILREYICSMKQNMDETLSGGGLSFYTKDYRTITEMVDVKKRLESFFWAAQDAKWTCAGEEDVETEAGSYSFCISPAGKQQVAITLEFTCVPQAALSAGVLQGADHVWILSDVPGMEAQDGYMAAVKSSVSGLTSGENGPKVAYLLSHLEHRTHYRGVGADSSMPDAARRKLYGMWKENFTGITGTTAKNTWLYLVQIYGGLQYVGCDEQGHLQLQVGQDGYYQKYLPAGCHLPIYYALESAKKAGGFLDTADGNVMWTAIQKSFAAYLTNMHWKPASVAEVEAM